MFSVSPEKLTCSFSFYVFIITHYKLRTINHKLAVYYDLPQRTLLYSSLHSCSEREIASKFADERRYHQQIISLFDSMQQRVVGCTDDC